ncbi:hypothetical protein FX987_02504 [Vreelandella titanicae]|jgi:hypothetical protein|uniref:Uncharacterized protein n=1 Tax=Vreelandella titanicae TaxID=664683 RepID=A0AAP9NMC5_9GAMM|nr:hypothetical protein FX987_02504 [Halomonas titanicae]
MPAYRYDIIVSREPASDAPSERSRINRSVAVPAVSPFWKIGAPAPRKLLMQHVGRKGAYLTVLKESGYVQLPQHSVVHDNSTSGMVTP